MLPRPLKYARPASVAEATAILAAHPAARPLAGGQSLVNVLKLRAAEVESLVDLSRLEELRGVEATADGGLEVGAGVRYAELAADPHIRERLPVLAEVADGTVDVQVRNRGTLGGNICFNDPTSNFPPLLVAADAVVLLTGPDGEREVPAPGFFLGPLRCDLRQGEIVRAVRFPAVPADAAIGYETLQLARDSWALARAVAYIQRNGTVSEARVVLACVGPRPARQPAMEEALRGTTGDPASIDAAVAAPIADHDAIGDSHASAEYRIEMARVYAKRAIAKALAQTGDHA